MTHNDFTYPISGDTRYQMSKDEIREVILEGIHDFIEKLQDGELASIRITIAPDNILISQKKKPMGDPDKVLGMAL